MCGIAGAIWTDDSKRITPGSLHAMTDAIRHRGPDEEGSHFESAPLRNGEDAQIGVAFGHRRLSIIDLSTGQQPMCNEDESVWIVFNGEIYNYQDFYASLEAKGHRFRSKCDTEVILHLYEEEGPDCIAKLNGMFALALWDRKKQTLLLTRDRLGKKPLYYRHEPGRLLFASELKSVLQAPNVPREIEPRALDEYFVYKYVPHPNTIFKGINKLPPGCLAIYRNDCVEIRPYWTPDLNREEILSAKDYSEQLRSLVTSAVQMRLRSDVPLGAFLSGGIDSTIVVGLMSRLMKEPVRTFTIGFPHQKYDETHYAKIVADAYGTIHETLEVKPDALSILPKLVWHYDEPYADSSAIPTWYVCEMTRRKVTVALSGDGGDELFAGYSRYFPVWASDFFDRLPSFVKKSLAATGEALLPSDGEFESRSRRARRFIGRLRKTPFERYLWAMSNFSEDSRADLYSDEFVESLGDSNPGLFLADAFEKCSRRTPVTAASLADMTTYLPCDIMTKTDIASMAHSLECRQPLLDYRVAELAAKMPQNLKYRWGKGKRILTETFADVIPPQLHNRPKMGFAVPLAEWFRNELKDLTRSVLCDDRAKSRSLFRPQAIEKIIVEHQSKRYDYSAQLWALLVLELWFREWIDGPPATVCS